MKTPSVAGQGVERSTCEADHQEERMVQRRRDRIQKDAAQAKIAAMLKETGTSLELKERVVKAQRQGRLLSARKPKDKDDEDEVQNAYDECFCILN